LSAPAAQPHPADLRRHHRDPEEDHRAAADRREQARDRLLSYYLETASAGDKHLLALLGTPVPATFTGRDSALAWLDAERPSLVAAVTMAASTGRDQIAMQLPIMLAEYFDWRRRDDDLLATSMISRDAAHRRGERRYEATVLNNIGFALREMRRFKEAIIAHQDAAVIFRETGDRHREGRALGNLGLALRAMGRFKEAIIAYQDAAAIFRETGDRPRGQGAK
jgi:tetratricopeptide (TPR) repeat protein